MTIFEVTACQRTLDGAPGAPATGPWPDNNVPRHRLCLLYRTVPREWCFSIGWTVPACYRHRVADRQSSPSNPLPKVLCASTEHDRVRLALPTPKVRDWPRTPWS